MEVTYKLNGGPLDGLDLPASDRRTGAVIDGWLLVPPIPGDLRCIFEICAKRLNPSTGQVAAGTTVHQYAVTSSIVQDDHVFVTAWAVMPSR